MKYTEYKKARDASWRILLKYNIAALPVNVSAICRAEGLQLCRYSDNKAEGALAALMAQTDGFLLNANNKYYIYYDDALPASRLRFTIAHELGHFILGHTGIAFSSDSTATMRNREPRGDEVGDEAAANVFASRLLAPACVLYALNVNVAQDVAQLCSISLQAASYRTARLQVLADRGRFYTSPLERQVYTNFEEFINLRQ